MDDGMGSPVAQWLALLPCSAGVLDLEVYLCGFPLGTSVSSNMIKEYGCYQPMKFALMAD